VLLHTRKTGAGLPLVILHGLFGAGDNWAGIGKALVEAGLPVEILAFDLRNHGESPHEAGMDYPLLAQDVRDTLAHAGIEEYHLLGHSMGGKVALQLACNPVDHSDHQGEPRVRTLTVVDIAPRQYQPSHQAILQALNALQPATLSSRSQADEQLATTIPEQNLRLFLLKNLRRDGTSGYQWQLNLPVLTQEYAKLLQAPTRTQQYSGPTLLVRGGLKPQRYVSDADLDLISQWCKEPEILTIADAGHWPHATHKPQVLDGLLTFYRAHTPGI